MFKVEKIRKISLTLTALLLLSIMMPVLAFAASLVNLVYNKDTGKLSGIIYSQQPTVGINVYSNGETVTLGTYNSTTVYGATYATVVDITYGGLSPEKINIIEAGVSQTIVPTVSGSTYTYSYDPAPAQPTITMAFPSTWSDSSLGGVLYWSANSEFDLKGYVLFLNGDEIGTVTGTTYAFKKLTKATTYTLGVAAEDIHGHRSSISTRDVYIPSLMKSASMGMNPIPSGYEARPGETLYTFVPSVDTLQSSALSILFPYFYSSTTHLSVFTAVYGNEVRASDFQLIKDDGTSIAITSASGYDYGNLFITLGEVLQAGHAYTLKLSSTSSGKEIKYPAGQSSDATSYLFLYEFMNNNVGKQIDTIAIKLSIGTTSEDPSDDDNVPGGPGGPGGPSTPPADDKKVIVNEESLKNGKDGKVAVEIADGKKEVLLPIKAAELVGNNKLEIKGSNLTALIPTEVLAKLQSLLSGDQLKDAQIKFSFDPVSSEDTSNLMNLVNGKGKPNVKAAGDVFEFSLSVITKDGKATALTTFEKPITLKMKFNDKANKALLGVYFIGDDGKLEYVGGKMVDGMLQADVFHFSKYAVLEFDKTFADVAADFWASNVIKKLAAKHLIDGVSDTEFAPSKEVTRAEFAAMLVRAYGLKSTKAPAFADVTKADWYFDAVAAAAEAGIVTGKSDTSFAPNETVTREEMAVMVVRAYEAASKTKAPSTQAAAFADLSSISSWASAAVNAAVELKLLSGRDNNSFAPTGKTTRAESAQVLSNLLEK